MFEARLKQGNLLKKLLDAIKDLVTEANFDCSSDGIALQAMDSSHVSLVSFLLRADGFEHFRCDRTLPLGINLSNMAKVLKCSEDDDSVTLKADDSPDNVTFMFENPSADKFSDFELKLMDIDSEHLGIPDTEYKCVIRMPSKELQRICRDLGAIGDTVSIHASKDGVKFSVSGDSGTGNITRRPVAAEKEEDSVVLEVEEELTLTFALRYLNSFTKATSLSPSVTLSLSPDVPLVVEYKIEDIGHIRYYLAPKIEEESSSSSS
eukprot:TRINITY_DN931_c0_g1_i1.p1 TRINITY_DN931_c0_g1~~TRINITY_DN931_c0_g1_i1.p1  ORF type:complete len:264 (+),score=115.15 TRINITY_DN931_c0_g1_i1:37-828(+)